MAAVAGVGSTPQPSQTQNLVQPQSSVTQAARRIFQRAKETAAYVWHVSLVTVKLAGGKVCFVAYQALEWLRPGWGIRTVALFGTLANIRQEVAFALREEGYRAQIDNLTRQNNALGADARFAAQARNENQRLTNENRQLVERNQFLGQMQEQLNLRETAVVRDRDALIQQRDLHAQRNEQLMQENRALALQRDQAQAAAAAATTAKNQLQAHLEQLQAQVPLLQQQLALLQNHKPLEEGFQKIILAFNQMQRRPNEHKTQLDDQLERILPQLLQHIESTQQMLTTAKQVQNVKGTAAETAIDSAAWLLKQVVEDLQRIPPALVQHRHWNNLVTFLHHNVQQPLAEV